MFDGMAPDDAGLTRTLVGSTEIPCGTVNTVGMLGRNVLGSQEVPSGRDAPVWGIRKETRLVGRSG